MGLLDGGVNREIKQAKLLGMREAHETLVFTTVNFSIYSFWVQYIDGSTEVIECSPSNPNDKWKKEKKLFDRLMAISNETAEKEPTNIISEISSTAILDELQKLKNLHDAGVIPDELFENKKSELVEQLSIPKQRQHTNSINLIMVRAKKRPAGEAKISTFVDGKKIEADLDDSISLHLEAGQHTVYFKRAALKSEKVRLLVADGKHYRVVVNPKAFELKTELIEE